MKETAIPNDIEEVRKYTKSYHIINTTFVSTEPEEKMGLNQMIEKMKRDPGFSQMGMIASHLGVVRETSLKGGRVRGIEVAFDPGNIENIIRDIKKMDGIINVLVEVNDGHLKVGDEIMAVVMGGDTREHVFPALIKAVDRIKTEATTKREIFVTL